MSLFDTKMELINTDTGTFKRSKCGHYYAFLNRKWYRVPSSRCIPYVVVTHIPTGRSFQMTRNYNLISINKRLPKGAVVKDEWKGWTPSGKNQMPDWAYGLPAEEFHAIWYM